MTDFLAHTLINFCAGVVTAGLQREIRKHTGVPNATSCALAEKRLIANVKTVTSGTDKSAGAAT